MSDNLTTKLVADLATKLVALRAMPQPLADAKAKLDQAQSALNELMNKQATLSIGVDALSGALGIDTPAKLDAALASDDHGIKTAVDALEKPSQPNGEPNQ